MPQPRWQYEIIQDWMTGNYLIHISIVRNHGCHCRWKFEVHIKVLESKPCWVNLGGDRGTATPLSLTTLVSFSVRFQMGLFQKGSCSDVWYDLYRKALYSQLVLFAQYVGISLQKQPLVLAQVANTCNGHSQACFRKQGVRMHIPLPVAV